MTKTVISVGLAAVLFASAWISRPRSSRLRHDTVPGTPRPLAAAKQTPAPAPTAQAPTPVSDDVAAIRQYLFTDEPNSWDKYAALLKLYREGDATRRDEIFALLTELEAAFPGSMSPPEALGTIHFEARAYELAIPFLERIREYSDRPFRNRTMLATAYLETGDAEAAIREAREMRTMLRDYAAKKRDATQLKEQPNDGNLFVACLLEATAHAHRGAIGQGRASLRSCYEGFSEAANGTNAALALMADDLESWQTLTFQEVVARLD